ALLFHAAAPGAAGGGTVVVPNRTHGLDHEVEGEQLLLSVTNPAGHHFRIGRTYADTVEPDAHAREGFDDLPAHGRSARPFRGRRTRARPGPQHALIARKGEKRLFLPQREIVGAGAEMQPHAK